MNRRSTLSTCCCETVDVKLTYVVGGCLPTGRERQPVPAAPAAVSSAAAASHFVTCPHRFVDFIPCSFNVSRRAVPVCAPQFRRYLVKHQRATHDA
jgi:hypothetical protein